jgi:hypothetical protein
LVGPMNRQHFLIGGGALALAGVGATYERLVQNLIHDCVEHALIQTAGTAEAPFS